MADLDGNFSLEGLAPGTYNVVGRFIGYRSHTSKRSSSPVTDVQVLQFNLFPETFVIEQAAEVVAKVDRARDTYMENIKKKSAASIDYISSQQIKRTGDNDAASCHEARVRRLNSRQLRVRARSVRPVSQDHSERR